MAVPKHKVTKSKRNMRRAHDAITAKTAVECPQTGELKLQHRAHIQDGTYYYKGREVKIGSRAVQTAE